MANATRDDMIAAALPADRAAIEDLDETIVSDFLDFAAASVGPKFGSVQAKAQALLALHWLSPSLQGGLVSTGVLSSEANGPASRSFAVPKLEGAEDEGIYLTTSYGQRYVLLRRQILATCFGTSSNRAVNIP